MSRGAIAKAFYNYENGPQSPAARPEELQITPCYTEESVIDSSIRVSCDHHYSYPSSSFSHEIHQPPMMISNTETGIVALRTNFATPRKAYMDLTDAIALLDETCPNPDASPSVTPKTPRTPLTPHPRNKRARSKSSDNSSNHSNEPLNDGQTLDNGLKERGKIRPFLRKIGVSKTEDRPFFSKIVPRIGIGIGKPYLERIGPSKATEKPFLDKIGSSKTLDKFTFDTAREVPRSMIRRTHTIVEPMTIEKIHTGNTNSDEPNDVILIVKDGTQFNHDSERGSGKTPLLKMYSFETEDLDQICCFGTNIRSDPARGASLDDILNCEPSSISSLQKTCNEIEFSDSKSESNSQCCDVAQLVKCRITTSHEIISSNIGRSTSPRTTAIKWHYSPECSAEQTVTTISKSIVNSSHFMSSELLCDDDNFVDPLTNKNISKVSSETRIPTCIRTETQNAIISENINKRDTIFRQVLDMEELNDETACSKLISSKSQRQTFDSLTEKCTESNHILNKERQVSVDIRDKTERQKNENGCRNNGRRGISSESLRYTRETLIGSATSAISVDSPSSGDSPLTIHRPSNNDKYAHQSDFTHRHKFELHDISVTVTPTTLKTQTVTTTTNSSTPSTGITTICNNGRYRFIPMKTSIGHSIKFSKTYDVTNEDCNSENEGMISTVEYSNNTEVLSKHEIIYHNNSYSEPVKSKLNKQERIDKSNNQGADVVGPSRMSMERMFHEPSQETMDLLTELRKVKSILKTPSHEVKDWELDYLKSARMPKKISLADKEFCLSMEREDSIRRPRPLKGSGMEDEIRYNTYEDNVSVDKQTFTSALFEKRCSSLDYADDVEPTNPGIRSISVAATEKRLPIEGKNIDASDPSIIYDSKRCLSDVCISPYDEFHENDDEHRTPHIVNVSTKSQNNHFLEVDIAIPINDTESISPKRRVQIQGITSDLYEIISPRSTPFRVKKRLGRICVEDSVMQESFAIGKVTDSRCGIIRKKTKCFPL